MVAQVGCQAAAACAKCLVWSYDCSARLFVAWSEALRGLASHRTFSVRVPICLWQPPPWAAGFESCPVKAVCELGSSHPSVMVKQCGYFCCCFPKLFSIAAVERFVSPLLPFPLAPSPPSALAFDTILNVPGEASVSFLPNYLFQLNTQLLPFLFSLSLLP